MKNTPTTPSSFLSRKGFTLIEIMIVITIIGILMAFLAPRLFGVSDGARDLQRKGDLTTLQTAIMKYQQDNGTYPALPTGCVDAAFLATFKTYLSGKSIKDPKGMDSGVCTTGYGYKVIGTEGFILTAGVEVYTTANAKKTDVTNASLTMDLADAASKGASKTDSVYMAIGR